MMARPFGRHLYSQIILPLVAASLVVGLLATVVAVYFLGNLTDKWIAQVAESATYTVEERLATQANNMVRMAKLASEDGRMKDALRAGDLTRARGVLVAGNVSLEFDNMMLLDGDGVILASTGLSELQPGQTALDEEYRTFTSLSMGHPTFMEIAGRDTVTVVQPVQVDVDGAVFILVLSEVIDDSFVDQISTSGVDAVAMYDRSFKPMGASVTVPEGPPRESDQSLWAAVESPSPEIEGALAEASDGEFASAAMNIDGDSHSIRAQRVRLPGDPVESSYAYVATVMNQGFTIQTSRTTINLITMWSVFAVLALVGLGGWVARRVSDPLVELTAGAKRIAGGDFSAQIHVAGANEVAELGETFNQMTESLRDRSESLTKKVLELATLYEMSRALGSTLDMNVLLESVLDSALRIFNLDLGYVTIRERETGNLELRAWRGPGLAELGEDALRNSMSEWVIREGRPLIFNPSSDSGGDGQVDAVSGALAALCVPLMTAEGAIGAVIVGSRNPDFRFSSDDVRLLSTIANHVTIAIGNIELFSSLQEAYFSTVRSLAAAVDAKDPFTRGHSDRVALYAKMMGEKLGLSAEQVTALEMAAFLHDIGKIGVKEEILLKPGRLTDAEMNQMRHHPLIGANILKPVGFPWPITPVVRHHHERWDGDGYPAGLKGDEIPLLARVLTVADAFEAMIADRPYRVGRTVEQGVEELRRCSGSQFDARVVDAFIEALDDSELFAGAADGVLLEEIEPDEARAIFVAVSEGMLSSFRKLGGPRLAANVERELNDVFEAQGYPISVSGGRVSVHFSDDSVGELVAMREALGLLDETMSQVSGETLVDHFYSDAMAGLSDRMRLLAHGLEFHI